MAKIPTLTFPGLASQQTVVRLSANGARMICADGLGNLRAWEIAAPPGPDEVASGRVDPGRLLLISKLRDGVSGIRAVAIDRSGCRAVSLGSDGTVRGWDLQLRNPGLSFDGSSATRLPLTQTPTMSAGLASRTTLSKTHSGESIQPTP